MDKKLLGLAEKMLTKERQKTIIKLERLDKILSKIRGNQELTHKEIQILTTDLGIVKK